LVLANLNRLAEAEQTTLPVHDTLDHFLGHVALAGWERLRDRAAQRLLRMKALDAARLLGHAVLLIDATGLICFHRRHCPHCLTRATGNGQTLYYHNVLEAKLVTPTGLVFSLESEFIENPGPHPSKQDCQLRAFYRLAARLQGRFPRLSVLLVLDGLFAGGPTFALCQQYHWHYCIVLQRGTCPVSLKNSPPSPPWPPTSGSRCGPGRRPRSSSASAGSTRSAIATASNAITSCQCWSVARPSLPQPDRGKRLTFCGSLI
jgi:hypothetical protein